MGHMTPADHVDVLIVGAGISGIGMAVHLQKLCPDKQFAIVEQRRQAGGTWDLFRFPGVRSDSDMHTLGFGFKPWLDPKSIADGPAILAYLHETIAEHDLARHIRFSHKVLAASWSSAQARWRVTIVQDGGAHTRIDCNFLFMGSGYYNYHAPYDPGFAGADAFGGDIVHPQFWPKKLDYAGKRVVVIGSGATAVTLVPNLAETAAHVTMLQRSPTYMFLSPSRDRFANALRRFMPAKLAYRITRWKNVWLQRGLFKLARSRPDMIRNMLLGNIRKQLPEGSDMTHFEPRYNPWEQRLCLVPDSDLFQTLRDGKASIITDHIDRFDADGIVLKSGAHLRADMIVTATGLKLAVLGKVDFTVDGEPVHFYRCFYYKGCMFSNVPNMTTVFGYLNASWTLKADIVSQFTCRLLNHMDATDTNFAKPVLTDPESVTEEDVFDFSSGYIQRSLSELPKSGAHAPWRLSQDYISDRKILRHAALEDGVLQFDKAGKFVQSADMQSETQPV